MSDFLKPPSVPVAILHFFADQPDLPVLTGDMSEEFQQRARTSGARAAQLWFWWETIRNIWAFTSREMLRTPVQIAAIALGCAVAVNLVLAWSELFFLQLNLRRVHAPGLVWDALMALEIIAPLLAGCAGAKLAVGREWTLTLLFTVASACCFAERWYTLPNLSAQLGLPAVPPPTLFVYLYLWRIAVFWLGSLSIRQWRLVSSPRGS